MFLYVVGSFSFNSISSSLISCPSSFVRISSSVPGDSPSPSIHALKYNPVPPQKIGVSIYSYLTLDKVLNKYKFDVVQLPFNIFDRRLLTNKYFQKIKNKEIEIHIRSIFLQGLLLRDYKKIPKYFKKWKRIFLSWEKWCEKKNISKLQSCLNFVSSYKKIDKVIIGVADEKELIQILKCIKKISKNYPKKIFLNDIKLIDPRKWKKT